MVTRARRTALENLTHEQAVNHLIDYADGFGWMVCTRGTTRPGSTPFDQCGAGCPDLTCVGLGWVAFIWVRTGPDLAPEQLEWCRTLLDVAEQAESRVTPIVPIVTEPSDLHLVEMFLATGDTAALFPVRDAPGRSHG